MNRASCLLNVGRVVLGRVFFGASCLGASCLWGELSVIPAYCVLLAGPLPLQGALNHWGRYLPQGPTICMLCASGGATPFAGHP